ncbi:hypothetical protein O181_070363 [Austropuccinia psidii MF-1]|uniref:Uncharacterized protein n=1 Tax=Austropuccinia psidii MF-1 TaxID=1389203 RepID=A0A9Q3I770_9BASI|nr:hypothetical protein [Austropuccinia psidii MF-1]
MEARKVLGKHEMRKLANFDKTLNQFCTSLRRAFAATDEMKWKQCAGRKLVNYVKISTQGALLHIRLINEAFQPTLFAADELPAIQWEAFNLFKRFWKVTLLEEGRLKGLENIVLAVRGDFLKDTRTRTYELHHAIWDLTEIWMFSYCPLLQERYGCQKILSYLFRELIQDKILLINEKLPSAKNWVVLENDSDIYKCPDHPRIAVEPGWLQTIISRKKQKMGASSIV